MLKMKGSKIYGINYFINLFKRNKINNNIINLINLKNIKNKINIYSKIQKELIFIHIILIIIFTMKLK